MLISHVFLFDMVCAVLSSFQLQGPWFESIGLAEVDRNSVYDETRNQMGCILIIAKTACAATSGRLLLLLLLLLLLSLLLLSLLLLSLLRLSLLLLSLLLLSLLRLSLLLLSLLLLSLLLLSLLLLSVLLLSVLLLSVLLLSLLLLSLTLLSLLLLSLLLLLVEVVVAEVVGVAQRRAGLAQGPVQLLPTSRGSAQCFVQTQHAEVIPCFVPIVFCIWHVQVWWRKWWHLLSVRNVSCKSSMLKWYRVLRCAHCVLHVTCAVLVAKVMTSTLCAQCFVQIQYVELEPCLVVCPCMVFCTSWVDFKQVDRLHAECVCPCGGLTSRGLGWLNLGTKYDSKWLHCCSFLGVACPRGHFRNLWDFVGIVLLAMASWAQLWAGPAFETSDSGRAGNDEGWSDVIHVDENKIKYIKWLI